MGAETASGRTLATSLEPQGVNPPPAPEGEPSYPHHGTIGYDESDGIGKAPVGEEQESLEERFSKMPLTELVGRFEGIHARLKLLEVTPNPEEWGSEIAQFGAAVKALINYPTTHPKMSSDEQIAYNNVFLAVRDGLVPPVSVQPEPDETPNTERQQELEARYQKIKEIYISFRQRNHFDQRPLGGNPLERARTPEEMQVLSNSLQLEIARALGVDDEKIEKMRHIDPNAVQEFAFLMRDGGTVLMRHGPQDSHATKIDQMSPPNNMDDPATLEGLAEFAATLLAIEYTLDRMQVKDPHHYRPVKLRIVSSPNQRALDVAEVIGAVFNVKVERDERLQCMDYQDNIVHGNENLNGDDSVDWKKDKIDAVFGEGSYDKKTQQVQQIIDETQQNDDVTLTILIGHTQDTNAADKIAKREPERLSNFGGIFYPAGPDFTSFRMSDGVYQPKSVSVSPTTSLQPDTQATHESGTAQPPTTLKGPNDQQILYSDLPGVQVISNTRGDVLREQHHQQQLWEELVVNARGQANFTVDRVLLLVKAPYERGQIAHILKIDPDMVRPHLKGMYQELTEKATSRHFLQFLLANSDRLGGLPPVPSQEVIYDNSFSQIAHYIDSMVNPLFAKALAILDSPSPEDYEFVQKVKDMLKEFANGEDVPLRDVALALKQDLLIPHAKELDLLKDYLQTHQMQDAAEDATSPDPSSSTPDYKILSAFPNASLQFINALIHALRKGHL